jgi:anti-sigma regulatory factor (Ser/Thr protein kinase)
VGDAVSEELSCRVEDAAEALVLVVGGPLSLRTTPRLSTVLRKHLLDRGRVLVDLSGTWLGWRPALNLFPAALAVTGGWPSARLALFGAPAGVAAALHATGMSVEVHVAADRHEALSLLGHRPRRVRRTTSLPISGEAALLARLLVKEACADWDLPVLVERARIVVNELVTNAVEHSGGRDGVTMMLSLDGRGLTIGVDDGWRPSSAMELHRRAQLGLRVVDELSDGWGVTTRADGKTVWALLRTGASDAS